MSRPSFDNQAEMKLYERGRTDALEELFRLFYGQLKERGAFPDVDASAFAKWGEEVLLPELSRHRGQDDLYDQLMNI